MTELQRRSPLATVLPRPFVAEQFELRELPNVIKLRVQVLRDRGVTAPCVDPQYWPLAPNTSLGSDPAVLWKAPDDWLVYSQALSGEHLSRQLSDKTPSAQLIVTASAPEGPSWPSGSDKTASAQLIVTDISAATIVLELRGPRTVDVLMRDCTLDLEGDTIAPGGCAQTAFAQVNVLIHRPADTDAWRLFIDRSVALHVCEWLML